MEKDLKDILLKDLCARLPYGVIVNVKGFDYDYNDKLTQIYKGVGCSIQVTTNMPYDIEQVKPYLFPMSSMTKEQREEMNSFDPFQTEETKTLGDWAVCLVDFYNKHRFDYRGLIEKGLAIDATGLNIY